MLGGSTRISARSREPGPSRHPPSTARARALVVPAVVARVAGTGETLIPLDRVKVCTNPQCRLILPADPDNELEAGFWVTARVAGGGSRVKRWNSRCKDCIRRSRHRGVRRTPKTWIVEFEGKLTQMRRCVGCPTEGPCLDDSRTVFGVKGRDANGVAIQWSVLCRACYNSEQKARRCAAGGLQREEQNERRRERYHERMSQEIEYRERVRAAGRSYYANHPELREARLEANRRWKARRRKEDAQELRELERIDRALRQERKGIPLREREGTVIDSTQPRILVGPFREWLAAYSDAMEFKSDEDLAKDLDMTPRRVHSILDGNGEYERVAQDIVDRAIICSTKVVAVNGKEIFCLDDLYPYGEERDAG